MKTRLQQIALLSATATRCHTTRCCAAHRVAVAAAALPLAEETSASVKVVVEVSSTPSGSNSLVILLQGVVAPGDIHRIEIEEAWKKQLSEVPNESLVIDVYSTPDDVQHVEN